MAKNLYTNEAIFRLIVDGNTTRINEPVKWDAVKIKLMRDPDTYGANSEFSEDETALQFPKGQGYEIIKEQYELHGCDAYIEFTFSYLDRFGNESNEFYGTLNLSSYAIDDVFVYTTIEKQTFENLLRTRYETKVSFNAKETLDGEVLPVPDLSGMVQNYNNEPVAIQEEWIGTMYQSLFLSHEITQIVNSDIREFQLGNLDLQSTEPIYQDVPQIIVDRTRYYTLNLAWNGIFKFNTVNSSGAAVNSVPITIRPYLKVYRGTSFVVDDDYDTYTINQTVNNQSNSININHSRSLTLNEGDKVIFGVRIFMNSALGVYFKAVDISNYQNVFELSSVASETDYPFRGFTMNLHSKEIVRYSETKTPSNEPDTYTNESVGLTDAWLQLDSETQLTSEIAGMVNVPLGIIENNPMDTDQYTLKAEETGTVDYEYTFTGRVLIPGATASTLTYTPAIIIKKASTGVVTIKGYPAKAKTVTGVNIRNFVMSFSIQDNIYLEPDDQLYLGCRINCPIVGNVTINNSFSNIKISQSTVAPPTTCRAYNFLDAVKFIVKIITGADSDKVISSFFDTGGCGEKHAITNGFQLRNFEVFDRPVQASLKDLLEGARDFWNVGFSLKTDENGTDYMIIQPFSEFFSGDEILHINEVANLKEEHDKDLVFNEINIGFAKYADDDNNYLDDVNTYHEYLTPIKTYKAKKAIQCKLITSGYLIEQQRREQFADTPSRSVTNDDELFLIKYVKDYREFKNVTFGVDEEGTTGTFLFSKSLGLTTGDKFILNGGLSGANDGITYTVVTKDDFQELYYVDPAPLYDLGAGTVLVPISNVEAEKNENYNTIGILSPNSAYNLSLTPKQQLFWWRNYFNIGFTSKQKSDLLKCTFVKQNKDAQLEALDDTACQVLPSGYVKMDGNVSIEQLGYLNRPFTPIKTSFKCKLPYTQISLLKKAIRGELVGTESFRNFGYITYTDYDGIEWQAHVSTLEYNPMTEEVNIEAYKIDKN